MERYDALVIGGGPAGATAAWLLARAGWSVALAEGRQFPRRKVCGEYLSATNWPLFKTLGLAEAFADLAGPPVRETAVIVGSTRQRADLPRPVQGRWGQALAREHLDTLLLASAVRNGVDVRQPCRCTGLAADPLGFTCRLEPHPTGPASDLHARIVIAAHGSWEIGNLGTQRRPAPARPGDWMAFKAHFRETGLPEGLMPLLSFPDGYGGMVHCDGGRASLSCCIRRERLQRLERTTGQSAGSSVLGHILESSPALRPVLESAALEGPWLSAGPIQPGIRRRYRDGVFVIGNAAGEAHPAVAEGISMAMQSAWLLAESLIPLRAQLDQPGARERAAAAYSSAWRQSFATRIRAASVLAHWCRRPKVVAATLPLLSGCPSLMALAVRLTGKAKLVAACEGQ